MTLVAGLTALLMITGCIHRVQSGPLLPSEGWRFFRDQDPKFLDPAIQEDYRTYIKNLPKREGDVLFVSLFTDGKGRHAVAIEVERNGTNWTHVLIYDSTNRRVKRVKYVSGHNQG